MKKNNPEIKNESTLKMQDEIDTIEMIADMFFKEVTDKNGNTVLKYTPYLEPIGQVNAIIRYFIDGIEFDEDEDVYDEAMNDKDIRQLIDQFFIPYNEKVETITHHQKIFSDIMIKVHDIVEYRKAINIANIQGESNSILTYKILELIETEQEKNNKEIDAVNNLNAWIGEQRELNSLITPEMQRDFAQNFDVNTLTEAIYNKMSESDLHKRNREVIKLAHENREKDNKIIEMQNEFAKEKQKENVKNVLSD